MMSKLVVACLLAMVLGAGTARAQVDSVTSVIPSGSDAESVRVHVACSRNGIWIGRTPGFEYVALDTCPSPSVCHPCMSLQFTVPGGVTTQQFTSTLEVGYDPALNRFHTWFRLTPPGGPLVDISDAGPVSFGSGQIVVNASHNAVPEDCSDDLDASPHVPGRLALHAPVPNPFRLSAEITFDLAREGDVSLRLYDAGGRRIRTLVSGFLPAGPHRVQWEGLDDHGRRVPPGAYFCRLANGAAADQVRIVRTN